MTWVARKMDSLAGAVIAAGTGMLVSQAPPFTGQYLHRLGLRVDEARDALAQALTVADGTVPDPLGTALAQRLSTLEQTYQSLSSCGPWTRPLALALRVDGALAGVTLDHFIPALPLGPVALVYTLGGLLLGLAVYEALKLPVRLTRPPPSRLSRPRRLFESRGGL